MILILFLSRHCPNLTVEIQNTKNSSHEEQYIRPNLNYHEKWLIIIHDVSDISKKPIYVPAPQRSVKSCSKSTLQLLQHTGLCIGGCVGCGVKAIATSAHRCAIDCTKPVSAIYITVYTRVDFVGQIRVLGAGIRAADAVGTDAATAGVVVATVEAGLAWVEISFCRMLHQVAVVRSR